ncbi:hypothetical protein [Hugenholtzia roseola]|uniref:hypothetical protein n=1 Tax=Hugenholtzia roseola TaxID=1002 RepID=UPI00047C7FE4|nr:hypothetical protein [Hugenholtzia roseola]
MFQKTTPSIQDNKILRTILVTVFGAWFAYKLYQTYQDDFFLDGIILLIIALIGLLVLIWTIRKDLKAFQTSQKLTSYLPTFIGLLFILANIGLFYYQNNKINTPTLIRAFYDGDFNGFSVDFKKNGNYVIANGSGLGQRYFYGTYTLKDSLITIDKSSISTCIKTNKFVIRTENYYPKDNIHLIKSKANYITQIDEKGNEIDREFRLRVIEDSRNE